MSQHAKTIRLIVCGFCTIATFLLFSAGSSAAASRDITFRGVITKPDETSRFQTYPQVLVTFGSQIILPVNDELIGSGNLLVLDDAGEMVSNVVVSFASEHGKSAGLLVDLKTGKTQTITVCSRGQFGCTRYRVSRQ